MKRDELYVQEEVVAINRLKQYLCYDHRGAAGI